MENKEELQKKNAWLESRLDQVETEMTRLNTLLLNCGFPEGIKTLRVTIEELLSEAEDLYKNPPEDRPPTQIFEF